MTDVELLRDVFITQTNDKDVYIRDMYVRISKDAIDSILEQIETAKRFLCTKEEIIFPIKSCDIDEGRVWLNLETEDDMPF